MDFEVTLPEWAFDTLGKEAEIVELSAHDLALLFLAEKVEHTHTPPEEEPAAEAGE
jgi:hypothetical protein